MSRLFSAVLLIPFALLLVHDMAAQTTPIGLTGVTTGSVLSPQPPTVTTGAGCSGTPTTFWKYKVIAVDAGGGTTTASGEGSIENTCTNISGGSNSLNGINYIQIRTYPVIGAAYCNVYRTGPVSTGKISDTIGNSNIPCGAVVFDNGSSAGDGTSPPGIDTSGSISPHGIVTAQAFNATGSAAGTEILSTGITQLPTCATAVPPYVSCIPAGGAFFQQAPTGIGTTLGITWPTSFTSASSPFYGPMLLGSTLSANGAAPVNIGTLTNPNNSELATAFGTLPINDLLMVGNNLDVVDAGVAVANVSTPVDSIQITPSATGSLTTVKLGAFAFGTDANINLDLFSKGTGAVQVTAGGSTNGWSMATGGLWEPIGTGTLALGGTAHGLAITEGATTALNLLASPTTNGNCVVSFNVTGAAAIDPTCALQGIPVRAQSTNYTLAYSDRNSYVKESGGSTATLTLPQITGNTASNFPFVTQNLNTGNLTITANAADKIDNGTTGGSVTVLPNFAAWVYQDSTSGPGNWWTIKAPTIGAFPTCSTTLQFSSTAGITCPTGTQGGIPYFSGVGGGVLLSSASLTQNAVVIGGGTGTPTTTVSDANTTHALFATSGAPAFRALVSSDLPQSGTGTKTQSTNMSSTTTTGDVVTLDGNANTVDSGKALGNAMLWSICLGRIGATSGSYYPLVPGSAGSANCTGLSVAEMPMAYACTAQKLYVNLGTAPTGTLTVSLFQNNGGSATALSCIVSSGTTTCHDISDNVTFAASDTWSIRAKPAAAGDAAADVRAAFQCQ